MRGLKTRLLRLAVHIRRHPYLHAGIGFSAGLASFLLVERQQGMAGAIAFCMLVVWLLLLLEKPICFLLKRYTGVELPKVLVYFTTQMVHQESFFFVLPFFLLTTTWNSLQAVFTLVISAAALISVVDPIYTGWLAQKRWLYLAYHSLALFLVLLTALPIIVHLSTPETYAVSVLLALAFALPSLYRVIPVGGWRGAGGLLGLTLALASVAWIGRVAVPPASLWLTKVSVSSEVDEEHRQANGSRQRLTTEELLDSGLYAYTAVRAPRGLKEEVHHQWIHNGTVYDDITLDIAGGREAGYRAWTRKQNFPEDPTGHWEVRVTTDSGQILGVLRFEVEG